MRLSRDLIVVVFLFAVLTVLAGLAASMRYTPEDPYSFVSYSTHNVQPSGTQALQRWLQALGRQTVRIETATFTIPSDVQTLFVLRSESFDDSDDADTLIKWIERGNTVIVLDTADYAIEPNALARALNLGEPKNFDTLVERASVEQPILGNLPSPLVHANHGLTLDRSDYVEYLSANNSPLLVSFKLEKGTVWFCAAPYIFTNDGLRDESNAALVGALLSDAPSNSAVAFDEYHLGIRQNGSGRSSIQALLYSTPWGWAIVYALVVVLAFLVINGQRFGRVQPLPQTIMRRRPAEYVTSLAQLYRRAGKSSIVLHHYFQHLKRNLGRPYRINPNLPDAEFVDALARQDDRIDRDALTRTLNALQQTQIGESGLVKVANQAIKIFQGTKNAK